MPVATNNNSSTLKDKVQRILIFTHDSSLYGASLSLLTLLEHLRNHDSYRIYVLLPYKGSLENRLSALNIDYSVISYPRCLSYRSKSLSRQIKNILLYYWTKYKVSAELINFVSHYNPDLIYSNTSAVAVGFKVAKKLNIPHLWHIREFGKFDYQYLPSWNSIARIIRKSQISVYTSHNLRNKWQNGREINSKVVYNGICNDEENRPLIAPNVKFIFGLLGAVMQGKGQDIAVQGFSELLKVYPFCELHFYGDIADPVYHRKIKDLIEKHGIRDNVIFHKFEEDKDSIYKHLSVVLSCSQIEGFGRTIVEAMGKGIPVIANASGGPLEIIDNGINGMFYHQTHESLAEIMIQLVSDKNLYEQISQKAIEKAQSKFSVKKYVSEIESIINEILYHK